MRDRNDWNRQTIEEFRANGGKVGGMWEGKPLLLLTTTGAKSGQRRTNPGTPTNPDWYYNLLAHPEVTVEVGAETYAATATVLSGEERDRLYAKQAGLYPQFAEYQAKTTRQIPVIALERREG